LSFIIALVLNNIFILWPESRGTHDHVLPGGPGPRIYIPQEQGGPVIGPDIWFLFVASYDSQSYGGGIQIRLRTGFKHWISSN
jgi:hypothetical protein